MPSAMVDTAAAAPLKPSSRRHRTATLSDAIAGCAVAASPKPKAKTVASRYLAPFSKQPAVSPSATASTASACRRGAMSPATRRNTTSEQTLLLNAVTADATASGGSATATTRTLSVAFQAPTYCLDTSKARPVSPAAATAAFSPEMRRLSTSATHVRGTVSDGGQNTYRWPASATAAAPHAGAVAKSMQYSAASRKGAYPARSRAVDGTPRRASVDGANEFLRALSSDTEKPAPGVASGPRPSPRSVLTSSSARFSRDAVGTRSDRFAYPSTPVPSRAPAVASPSSPAKKKRSLFNGLLSSPFSRQSHNKQPPPSRPVGSSFRMTESSPSRARRSMDLPGIVGNLQGKACSLDGDMKKVTAPGATKAEEEHQLRLLCTRHLQWRHASAQAAAALSSRTIAAEKTLYGAWIAILWTRKSVAVKKLQLQLLRNDINLMAVMRGQMMYLEEWSSLETVHANSLSGTAQALNATVLRLPVSDGAVTDVQALKTAVGSAVDIMQAVGNSTRTQLPKLVRTNALVSQLSRVSIQELVLMAQCRELLSTLASMQVKYSSLQVQRIQLNQRRQNPFHFQ